jgi:hypothetical protein
MKKYDGIVRRALQTSLIVGSVLVLINQSDIFWGNGLTIVRTNQIILCYVVPFIVSLYSQIQIIKQKQTSEDLPAKDNNIPAR